MALLRVVSCSEGLGNYVLEPIVAARRRVYVSSPWLSEEFAELLLRKSREGVEVRLVTTLDRPPYHARALARLLVAERVVLRPGRPILLGLGLALLVAGAPLALASPALALIAVVGLALVLRSLPRRGVRVSTPLGSGLVVTKAPVHAKLIVADGLVGVGSVNLTRAGVYGNVECFAWIEASEEEAERLWRPIEEAAAKSAVPLSEVHKAVAKWTAQKRK
ncbi:MAG: phospholipase D-like domain-containing protein [Desulfurococcaceae archaeon]